MVRTPLYYGRGINHTIHKSPRGLFLHLWLIQSDFYSINFFPTLLLLRPLPLSLSALLPWSAPVTITLCDTIINYSSEATLDPFCERCSCSWSRLHLEKPAESLVCLIKDWKFNIKDAWTDSLKNTDKNLKSEWPNQGFNSLESGLPVISICHKSGLNMIPFMAPLPTNCYLRVTSPHCQKAYDDHFGGRSNGPLNLPCYQDVNF